MLLNGKRVLVTGGSGFLGRHVVSELVEAGASVLPIGRLDYDLRDRREVQRMMFDLRPEVVVHLAAVLGGIATNESEPGRLFYENAIMGIELIEACRQSGVQKTVIAGTISCYPRDASVPFVEEDIWNGHPHETEAAFAMAKRALLAQVHAYRKQYGMNICYLVPTNLYGPGDRLDPIGSHVIPAMVRKFLEARANGEDTVVLWGDGTPTREFLYVDDAARAFRLALERYDRSAPINVGSGEEVSIRDLANVVREATEFTGSIQWDHSRPNGPARRRVLSSTAHRLLKWEPEIPLRTGIERTVAWAAAELRMPAPTRAAVPAGAGAGVGSVA
jgi:GDP-L-fucose synthase